MPPERIFELFKIGHLVFVVCRADTHKTKPRKTSLKCSRRKEFYGRLEKMDSGPGTVHFWRVSDRIAKTFENLASQGKCGFIAYVTAGDPSPAAMPSILAALDRAGTDVIELGIPFSDPLADGPTIQAASGRALAAGMTVHGVLELVREFRETSSTPIVLFTYLNPIFAFGFEKFLQEAAAAGADGLLVLDMPPEEAAANAGMLWSGGLDPIRLVAPTTPSARMKGICETARGFIYYVSREGVTGEQTSLSTSIASQVEMLRTFTALPIAVGFGISTPAQSAEVGRHADAVVVGSAIVRHIAESPDPAAVAQRVEDFVAPLAAAAHEARTVAG